MIKAPQNHHVSNGVNFSVIMDDRFKTGRISASMFLPLDKKTASANSILINILSRSCKSNPTFASLNQRLGELYGASLASDIDKIGESQVLNLCATFLDDRYSLDGESISEQLTALLCDMLFNPNLIDNHFKEDDIEQEKRQLIELIESEYNDKKTYAKLRCQEIMCANENFSINPLGTKEQVLALSPSDIYDAWQNMITHARFEIMMLGDTKPDLAIGEFKKAFNKVNRESTLDSSATFLQSASQVKRITETADIVQSKLVMGFRTGSINPDDNVVARRVMNSLLGGTPHSKLFLNVREKLSLCYYCASRYDRNKGLMLIESGVEKKNIDHAVEEISNQLNAIKKGDFTQNEIDATKLSLANSFRTISDYLGGLENFYIAQAFCKEIKTPEQCVDEVNKVTKDEIVEVANKITLDTIYTLTN